MPIHSKRHDLTRVGIDTGGTFTDFVIEQAGELRTHKVLSTPDAPERAILQGLRELGLRDQPLRLIHGSTVATNAVLERKGVRTGFVTNKGLRDILLIGRQARPELYNLTPIPPIPLVERQWCWEVDTRLAADGELLTELTDESIQSLIEQVRIAKPQAIAISLLFSFLDDRQELHLRDALQAEFPDLFISISSIILPEFKEYERGMTTWFNAYVGPLVQGYLSRMTDALPQSDVAIMQSSGLTCDARQAGERAVNLLLSGPAGGLEGARAIASLAGYDRLMTLDMGGTSTDVSLIDGMIASTTEAKIGNYPVSVPMVDIHTIGAGGGSLAWVDSGGLLQVGPESAGAMPGPVCYGQGGECVTVTDANLVLGRLPASTRLGGEMMLDKKAALDGMQNLADELGLDSAQDAAQGIVQLANEHMAAALRVISVQKGHDPARFVLVCFGGAGGLHVCELAEALSMQEALVPVGGGVLSALGMLAARPGRQVSRTLAQLLDDLREADLHDVIQDLLNEARTDLMGSGYSTDAFSEEATLDLCYKGQSFTLNVPWQENRNAVAEAFHQLHQQRYGHVHPFPIELVNVRVSVWVTQAALSLHAQAEGETTEWLEEVSVHGCDQAVPVFAREDLVCDQKMTGPAIITEKVATTFVAADWLCRVDQKGSLILNKLS